MAESAGRGCSGFVHEWFRARATAGEPLATFAHAWRSVHKPGVSLPEQQAATADWFERAAKAGLALAMRQLGMAYRHGEGRPADMRAATRWLRRAIDCSVPHAGNAEGGAH